MAMHDWIINVTISGLVSGLYAYMTLPHFPPPFAPLRLLPLLLLSTLLLETGKFAPGLLSQLLQYDPDL